MPELAEALPLAGGHSRAWQKVRRSRAAMAGALLVALYLGAAAFAGFAKRGPREISQDSQLQSPGAGKWFGTDHLGRDMMSRVLHGARWSLPRTAWRGRAGPRARAA